MATKTIEQRIVKTDGICGGKSRIEGHRITVQNVVIWHDRLGLSADGIAAEYDLKLSDIYAALAYYFSHRKEVDRDIGKGEVLVKEMRANTPSLLHKKIKGMRE